MTASVFDIQRFSVHDGPGIRTTVFFRGCPLRCAWCHNPEGLSPTPILQWMKNDCIGCGLCGDRTSADDAARCPTGALHVCGREWEIDALYREVLRDRGFFGEDGGLTCSGGECLLQADAVRELLLRAKSDGISTVIDTSGCVPWEAFAKTLDVCDRYLYDVKCADPKKHKAGTGVDNQRILENLKHLSEVGARIWLRVPVIPGFNADDGEMTAIASIAANVKTAERVTLIPYHTLGVQKYESVGMEYKMADVKPPSKEQMETFARIFADAGMDVR